MLNQKYLSLSFAATNYCAILEHNNDVFKFKTALKRFLLANAFYTLDEYYSWKQGLCLPVLHFKNNIITLLLFNYLLTSFNYDYIQALVINSVCD